MANYYRQCPNCGGRTADTSCEICGRKTFVTNTLFEDNELEKTSELVYGTDIKQEDSKEGHLQKMMREGRQYQKNASVNTDSKKLILPIIIGIIVVLIPFAFEAFQEEQLTQEADVYYDKIDEQYMYFEDYLFTVQDDTTLSCTVDEVDKEWFYVKNTTPYLFNANIELQTLKGKELTSFYLGNPYTAESSVASGSIQSCKVTDIEYQSLNIYKTNIAYEMTYDDSYTETILLQEDLSEQDLELLLKRIYACHILTYNTYEEIIKVMVNDVYAYVVDVDYENATLYVTNINNQKKTVISLDII